MKVFMLAVISDLAFLLRRLSSCKIVGHSSDLILIAGFASDMDTILFIIGVFNNEDALFSIGDLTLRHSTEST